MKSSHFTGDPPHGDGDVVFGRSVQVGAADGDHRSSGCWTFVRRDTLRFGILEGENNERYCGAASFSVSLKLKKQHSDDAQSQNFLFTFKF